MASLVDRYLKYLLVSPGILTVAVLTLYPLSTLIPMAFSEVSFSIAGVEYRYIGLKNLHDLAEDPGFQISFQNTIIFSAASVAIEVVIGLFLALIVSEIRYQNLVRPVLLTTMMMPPVTVALIFRLLLNADFGLVNALLISFGFGWVNWLGDPKIALLSIIIVDVWHWTAFVFLVSLAGIAALPVEPFEAAKIDGASRYQSFRYITLPLLRSTILVALLFRAIDILQAFPEIWCLTWGGPGFSTTILNILIAIVSFTWMNWGYAAMIGIILLIMGVALSIVTLKLRPRF